MRDVTCPVGHYTQIRGYMQLHDEFSGSTDDLENLIRDDYSPDRVYSGLRDLSRSTVIYGGDAARKLRVSIYDDLVIEKVVASLPDLYRSKVDFIRDAIIHRLHYWTTDNRLKDETQIEVREAMSFAEVTRSTSREQYYNGVFDDLAVALAKAQSPQAQHQIRRDISTIARNCQDSYWAKQFRDLANR